jgi:WD40 repeat protein
MVTFWDVQTGRQSRTLDGQAGSLAFSPDGLRLATSGNGRIKLRDVSTGREVFSLTANPEPQTALVLSPDGRWLAWGGMDPISRDDRWLAWIGVDPATAGREVRIFSGHAGFVESVAFTPDGLRLASGSYDKTIKLWETATGRELKTLTGHAGEVRSLAFSPDGHMLASGSENWTIKLWDTATGRELRTLIGEGGKVESFLSRVNSLVFSPDGRWLAAGNDDRTVRLWDVARWREARVMISDTTVSAIAFSPDGRLVASGPALNLWEVEAGREVLTLKAHLRVSKVAFSPDGRRLATVGGPSDDEIRIWEIATGRELVSLVGPGAGLDAVEFSPDGRNLIAAGLDGSARIWDAVTGEELAAVAYLVEADEWLVVSPDGLFDGSPGGWKRIVWRFGGNETAIVESFFNEYYYPGLLAEILAGRRPKAARAIAQLDRRQAEIKLTLANSPASTGSISTRTVSLKLEVAEAQADQTHRVGSGARDLRLFRNGSLVKVWRGQVPLNKQGKAFLEAMVSVVAGENRFTAYAFNNDNVKSTDASLVVIGADSLKRPGTAYILAVGINQYANQGYNLNYAVPDAQAFAEELARQQTKLENFGSVQVISLHNRDATKANILRALARLAGTDTGPLLAGAPADLAKLKPAEPEDAVFVYYAGHGTAAGPRFYLIPHDLGYAGSRTALNEAGLKIILAHSISDVDLERAFEKVDAGRLLLVIDACNSGQALEAEEKRRGPMNSKGLAQLAYEKGMYILTAAQGYQAALEAAQLGHGFLTYALVEEGLKTAAADTAPRDGQVVSREWLDYATLRVPQIQEAQMQVARKAGRDLVFVDGEQVIQEVAKRSLQRPRVFYRREPETVPLVIAKPEARP